MNYPVVLRISQENKQNEALNEFYDYIERNAIDTEIYQIKDRIFFISPPTYESIVIIFGVAGSLASIASIFWMAYEKFKERKERNFQKPDLRIIINDPNIEKQIEILLDDDTNKDAFIASFTQKVSILTDEASKQNYEGAISQISNTRIWIKRK